MSSTAARRLVTAHSLVVARCAGLPVSLRLITRDVPLWHASETEISAVMPPPYWGFVWPGGYGVARHLGERPSLVAHKRVLDFGCGSALAGIAAARLGASSVLCNDIDALAVAASDLNAELNGVADRVSSTAENLVGSDLRGKVDVILAGDVAYDKEMAEPVLAWLLDQADRGVKVIVGCPGRQFLNPTLSRFVELGSYPLHPDLLENAASGFSSAKVYEIAPLRQ
jgi:predicted nicotinamide N-methyase